jgi:hypothetical protein
MPSEDIREEVNDHLLKNHVLVDRKVEKSSKRYKPYQHYERLSLEAIGTACFYAENKGIQVVLGDQPEIVYRQNIANSMTLMQL